MIVLGCAVLTVILVAGAYYLLRDKPPGRDAANQTTAAPADSSPGQISDQQRVEEMQRKAEEQREAEQQRLEALRKEEQRQAEAKRVKEQRLTEEKRIEEQRLAEEQRLKQELAQAEACSQALQGIVASRRLCDQGDLEQCRAGLTAGEEAARLNCPEKVAQEVSAEMQDLLQKIETKKPATPAPPAQTGKKVASASFDGTYSGRYMGRAAGLIKLTIRGRKVSGSMSDDRRGFRCDIVGSFNPKTGLLDAQIEGGVGRVAVTGWVQGQMENGSLSGRWKATGGGTKNGDWSADKQ